VAYVTKEQMAAAWARIGNTPDGRLARAHLLSILLDGIAPGQNPGAVHEGVGRLSVARELLNLMDAECENAGNADAIFIVRPDVGNAGGRGSRRRVGERADD
jgi:hypothetical protein